MLRKSKQDCQSDTVELEGIHHEMWKANNQVHRNKTGNNIELRYRIPRDLEHRIKGNIKLYVPILADDLTTKKTYVLTESEDEIELEDLSNPRATSQIAGQ